MISVSGQIFTPKPHRGGWICLGIGGVLLAIAVLLANIALNAPVSGVQFWRILGAATAFVLAILFLYRAIALLLLRFHFTRNGLTIRWGLTLHRIPMDAIRSVTPAPALPNCTLYGVTMPRWWVCRRENMWLFATGSAADSVMVKTVSAEIYLSPESAEAFIAAWEKRASFGETQFWHNAIERRGVLAYPLWFDRVARYLGVAAILLTLILAGAVFARYPVLPAIVHLPPNITGQTTAIIPREHLLWIPYSGIIIMLLNGFLGIVWYKKDRLATYLLWSLTILVEIGLWVGFRMVVG